MNAVNFVVQHTYDFEHKVWSRARHMNLGLVAMKVLGGAAREQGGFKVDEKHYEQAIRYALSVPGISVAVIGLENIKELEKAAAVVATAQPLSPGRRPGSGPNRLRSGRHAGMEGGLRRPAGLKPTPTSLSKTD